MESETADKLSPWLQRFRDHMALRNYSPESIKSYLFYLKRFFLYLAENGTTEIAAVTKETIRDYQTHLFEELNRRGESNSISHQNHALQAVKTFFRFLCEEDYLVADPARDITYGKGNKDRVVPIGKIACRYLENYIKAVRPSFIRHPYNNHLFLSLRGNRFSHNALTDMVKSYARKAKIKKNISPHTFRLAAWNKPLIASRKPLVWRVCAQAMMPSRWLRIRWATSFIGSTLERSTLVHHCRSKVRTMLICLRSRISRNCSRYCHARAVRLMVNWASRASSSARCSALRSRRFLSNFQRRPLRLGSCFCSIRRVLSMASEA